MMPDFQAAINRLEGQWRNLSGATYGSGSIAIGAARVWISYEFLIVLSPGSLTCCSFSLVSSENAFVVRAALSTGRHFGGLGIGR